MSCGINIGSCKKRRKTRKEEKTKRSKAKPLNVRLKSVYDFFLAFTISPVKHRIIHRIFSSYAITFDGKDYRLKSYV